MSGNLAEICGKSEGVYEEFYRQVDVAGAGIVSAQAGALFLKRSGLSGSVLGKIWELADRHHHGRLDKSEFFVALKLVALAQQGHEVSLSNLRMDIPAPSMDNENSWLIKPEDRTKYALIFEGLGPENGKLSGDKAKPVLVNSGLQVSVLGKIWEVSDIDKDGFLDCDEMILALHLVYCALKNEAVPNTLPDALVPPSKRSLLKQQQQRGTTEATRRASSAALSSSVAESRSRASSVSSIDSVGLPSALAGSSISPATAATGSLTGAQSAQFMRPPAPWVVDKAKWELMFRESDSNADGMVSGSDIKDIMMQSGLAQNHLAHIWALCDLKQSGLLNLDQFALAMHLIEQKRMFNVEPPAVLPPELIPPSFRPTPSGMNDISTSTHHDSEAFSSLLGSYAGAAVVTQPSDNKEIDAIAKEIEAFQSERRKLDSDVIALETDLTVKQSEIKNLEVELNTLESTVKQLERQKGEARKRLDDLDTQVDNLKVEVDQSTSSVKEQENQLNAKRQELQLLRDEEAKLEVHVRMGQASLQQANHKQTHIGQQLSMAKRNIDLIKSQMAILAAKEESLQAVIDSGDFASVRTDTTLLSRDPSLQLESLRSYDSSSYNVCGMVAEDPFKAADPFAAETSFGPSFGASDPFASHDPFGHHGAFAEDPFKAGDPFAPAGHSLRADAFSTSGSTVAFSAGELDPFGAAFAPVAEHDRQFQLSPLTQSSGPPSRPPPPGGKKPPRPAPPKSRPITPKTPEPLDPWAGIGEPPSSTGSGFAASDAGFADFADFGQFK